MEGPVHTFILYIFGIENLISVPKSYQDGETWAPGDILQKASL